MDVNNQHRGGSNYRCQTCTFRIKRFHNGSCALGVSLFTDHFLSGKGQIISTCVTTTETTNRISHHFYFQNHFNIGMSGNQIQICPNMLQQRMQWVVLNIQCIFTDDFLMHNNVEYQCSIPCKYMIGNFSFFIHAKQLKSVNANIWKAKSEWQWISMIDYGYSTFYFTDINNSIMYVRNLGKINFTMIMNC